MPMYRRLSFTAAHFAGWAPEATGLRTVGEFLAITLDALLEFVGVGRPPSLRASSARALSSRIAVRMSLML